MKESVASVIANFKSFIGSGWLMWVAFCIALIICFFLGKDKRKKIVTVSVILCVLIINPITYRLIGDRFLSGVYWRLFWTLPIVITIAVVLTEFAGRIDRRWLRMAAVGAMCLVIALTGKSVINRGTYTRAENDYQIPQAAIDVADIVLEDTEGGSTMIVAPDDLVCYIRQYTTKVKLAYGRDSWGFIGVPEWWQTEIYDLMHAEEMDYKMLREKAYEYETRYIVFDTTIYDLPKEIEDYGYDFVGETGKYRIYALEES